MLDVSQHCSTMIVLCGKLSVPAQWNCDLNSQNSYQFTLYILLTYNASISCQQIVYLVADYLAVCFVSYKFGKKLTYVNRLDDLKDVLYLDQVDIPQEVREYVIPTMA